MVLLSPSAIDLVALVCKKPPIFSPGLLIRSLIVPDFQWAASALFPMADFQYYDTCNGKLP